MLVLTRKVGESIVIDDEIVLKVTAVQGSRIKLAIEAPRARRIMRGEIADGTESNSPAPRQTDSQWSKSGTEGRCSSTVPPRTSAK